MELVQVAWCRPRTRSGACATCTSDPTSAASRSCGSSARRSGSHAERPRPARSSRDCSRRWTRRGRRLGHRPRRQHDPARRLTYLTLLRQISGERPARSAAAAAPRRRLLPGRARARSRAAPLRHTSAAHWWPRAKAWRGAARSAPCPGARGDRAASSCLRRVGCLRRRVPRPLGRPRHAAACAAPRSRVPGSAMSSARPRARRRAPAVLPPPARRRGAAPCLLCALLALSAAPVAAQGVVVGPKAGPSPNRSLPATGTGTITSQFLRVTGPFAMATAANSRIRRRSTSAAS